MGTESHFLCICGHTDGEHSAWSDACCVDTCICGGFEKRDVQPPPEPPAKPSSRTAWERLILSDEERDGELARQRVFERVHVELQQKQKRDAIEASLHAQFGLLRVNDCLHSDRAFLAMKENEYKMVCVDCSLTVDAFVIVMHGKTEVVFKHYAPFRTADTTYTVRESVESIRERWAF